MFNREVECMEGYPYKVIKMNRARGGVICHCEEGTFLLKEYEGGQKRIEHLSWIQNRLEEAGFMIDSFLVNKENGVIGSDSYGGTYTLRKWMVGRECDPTSEEDLMKTVEILARLTKTFLELSREKPEDFWLTTNSFCQEVKRHNREIKSTSNYIRSRRKKSPFDELFQKQFPYFYEEGLEVEEREKELETSKKVRMSFCHRDYTHHNVFFLKEGTFIVHFDNLQWGSIVTDLSLFLRKVMEKNEWNCDLAEKILRKYDEILPLTEAELGQIYLRMRYPSRFLKVINHYSSTKKSWVSMRDCEKLLKLMEQEPLRQQFLVFLNQFVV